VAELLCQGAHEAEGVVECNAILDERAAVRAAVESMEENEVVFVFYDDYRAVRGVLREFGAVPTSRLPVRATARESEVAGVR
jgi:hypothetical protein